MSHDSDPTLSFRLRVSLNGIRLGDLLVIHLILVIRPDAIVAPSCTTLNESSHGETVSEGENGTLIADKKGDNTSADVVVDVYRALRSKSLRVPHSVGDHDCKADKVGYQAAT